MDSCHGSPAPSDHELSRGSPIGSCHGSAAPSDPMESVCRHFPPPPHLYLAVYLLSLSRTDSRQSDGLLPPQPVSIGSDGVRLWIFSTPSSAILCCIFTKSLANCLPVSLVAHGLLPSDSVWVYWTTLKHWTFELDDLVVRQLDVDILASNPFMVRNDNGVRPAKRQIEIGGTEIISYISPSRHTRQPIVRRTQSFLLRSPNRTVVLPGEYLQFITPSDADSDTLWALEPRLDCPSNTQRKPEDLWPPPQQIQSVYYAVRVSNTTDSPILLKRGEHLCQARNILPVEASISTSPPNTCGAVSSSPAICKPFSSRVIPDPDGCLDRDIREKFKALNLEFDDVFNPSISKYNGASGKVEAVVNIGSTPPPQRKGRLPQYNSNTLEELQATFDELEAAGVFAKPDQVNVHLISRVLGDLIQEGCVAKIADDLYVGGKSPVEVLDNWRRVLALLDKNSLRLTAAKTISCPRKAIVLGWVWSNGTLQASLHKLAALSSVEPPSTVQGFRSFVGDYKVLSRVLPRFAELLDPLDQAKGGKESRGKIVWGDELLLAFKSAQRALEDNRTITIPHPKMPYG